jgi:hypothetical protein
MAFSFNGNGLCQPLCSDGPSHLAFLDIPASPCQEELSADGSGWLDAAEYVMKAG